MLKKGQACGIDGIPNECLRHLPRRPLLHLTHLFNHCIWLAYFSEPWMVAKIITLPKPGKDPNSHRIYDQLASSPPRTNYLKKLFIK
jgi:hypothetical protein